MADLSFNEEPSSFQSYARETQKSSFLIGLVMRLGLAKDEKSAKFILGIVALVLFACAILFWFLNSPDTKATPTSEVLRQASQQQFLP